MVHSTALHYTASVLYLRAMDNTSLYRILYTIRRFEETVLENFSKGVFYGTTHTYLGQEANAAGILSHLQPDDIVFSNHRCHGHFLAYGGEPRALFAEMMGKPTGVCAGRGGSQHLHWRNFYSNGIQGGIVPLVTGMALAEKRKGNRALAVCFLGDGTLGQGVIYESFNLAALWQAPVLYVIEDNHIAQTTPTHLALAGEMAARLRSFGIPVEEADTSDVLEVHRLTGLLLEDVRLQSAPRALILHTLRFGPHSKGDDTRDPQVVAEWKAQRDPLKIHRTRLTPAQAAEVEAQVDQRIRAAFQQALEDEPYPAKVSLTPPSSPKITATFAPPPPDTLVLEALNAGLQHALQTDERVLLLGEDLLDPYGGAFKVTRGLSSAYPRRVLTTPISEAGFTGLAAGMALRGLRPVVEIMFGDFVTLIADQLINHIAKFRWMYNDQARVPLVIRAPMGGRRGYGPTHSQSLEKIYLGIPGLRVLAPAALGNPGALLAAAILHTADPVLFVENKLLYLERIFDGDTEWALTEERTSLAPCYRLTLQGAPPADLTIAAYGHMATLARQAATRLAYEHEIFAEIIVPTQLAPLDEGNIIASARRTGRLLTLEEGTLALGWGAEVVARVAEALGPSLRAVHRLAALDLPIPAAVPLEKRVLPQVEDILAAARRLVR